jgi:hypothetical protein
MTRHLRSLLRRFLGPRRYGALRHRFKPETGRAWGGPMNGQRFRCLLVAELVQKLEPLALVETGSYLGTTTEWLAAFQLPVHSCEASPESFGFAQARLTGVDNVTVTRDDSRAALRRLLDGPMRGTLRDPILFYLDAHWGADLPLREEVECIFERCPRAAVLIDDFQVPGDPGYAYDDYGAESRLTADYLAGPVGKFGLKLRYPATPAARETGARRGCCVVTGPALEGEMARVELLA